MHVHSFAPSVRGELYMLNGLRGCKRVRRATLPLLRLSRCFIDGVRFWTCWLRQCPGPLCQDWGSCNKETAGTDAGQELRVRVTKRAHGTNSSPTVHPQRVIAYAAIGCIHPPHATAIHRIQPVRRTEDLSLWPRRRPALCMAAVDGNSGDWWLGDSKKCSVQGQWSSLPPLVYSSGRWMVAAILCLM
eukprot:364245-Chlamydomonas_euryale.AAC.3